MARYALTDIHGCAKTFKTLVTDLLKLKKEDELYILGDLVNKGPDSKGVIDFILHLQKQHYRVYCLRGNHDHMLLKAIKKGADTVKFTPFEKEHILKSFDVKHVEDIPNKYIKFLKELPFYFKLPDYLLVHAGFDFKQADIFSDTDAMINIRNYKVDWSKIDNRRLLHGHTPIPLHNIRKTTSHNDSRLNLDAGCVYYKNAAYGNLVALDMDTQELFVQPNIDRPYTVARKN